MGGAGPPQNPRPRPFISTCQLKHLPCADPTRRSPGTPDPAEEPKQARKRQKLAEKAAGQAAADSGPSPLWRACAQGFARLDRWAGLLVTQAVGSEPEPWPSLA